MNRFTMEILCSVCSFKLSSADEVMATKCGHIYHSQCLKSWIFWFVEFLDCWCFNSHVFIFCFRSKFCSKCSKGIAEQDAINLYLYSKVKEKEQSVQTASELTSSRNSISIPQNSQQINKKSVTKGNSRMFYIVQKKQVGKETLVPHPLCKSGPHIIKPIKPIQLGAIPKSHPKEHQLPATSIQKVEAPPSSTFYQRNTNSECIKDDDKKRTIEETRGKRPNSDQLEDQASEAHTSKKQQISPPFEPIDNSQSLNVDKCNMMVIMKNGEQRLITFTMPNQTCTLQELLSQVGIPVEANCNIECIENPGANIDYIVNLGFCFKEYTKPVNNVITDPSDVNPLTRNIPRTLIYPNNPTSPSQLNSQNAQKHVNTPAPKYVTGFYAICSACGFEGEDHAKCQVCLRIFLEEPKTKRMPNNHFP